MYPTTAVSLKRVINSPKRDGKTFLTDWGKTMYLKTFILKRYSLKVLEKVLPPFDLYL